MHQINPTVIALLDQVRKNYEAIPEGYRKEMPTRILVRVVACLIPGVKAVDGSAPGSDLHTWLLINSCGKYIIDVLPTHIFPGPVLIVDRDRRPYTPAFEDGYVLNEELTKVNDAGCEFNVNEIAGATEAARRFLSTP